MKRLSFSLIELLIALIIFTTIASTLTFNALKNKNAASYSQSIQRCKMLFSRANDYCSLTQNDAKIHFKKNSDNKWVLTFAPLIKGTNKQKPIKVQQELFVLNLVETISLNNTTFFSLSFTFRPYQGLASLEARNEDDQLIPLSQFDINQENWFIEKPALELFCSPSLSYLDKKSLDLQKYMLHLEKFEPFSL